MTKKRLASIIFAGAVVFGFGITDAIGVPKPQAAKSTGSVLHFPKDRTVGHLLRLDTPRDWDRLREFGPACGDVVIPPRTIVGLKLSYAGLQDLTFLKNLDPSCVMLLDASRLDLDDDRAFSLQFLKGLRTLNLNNTDIGDKTLKYVSNLKQLVKLDLGETSITGKGLVNLAPLQLEDLSLMHDSLADDDLGALEGMQRLGILRLIGCRIGDKAMVHLAKMHGLWMLRLSRNLGITDAGVAYLGHLPDLVNLDLSETSVTPACAKYLKTLPKLKSLALSFHSYSAAEISAFKASLPHVEVVDRMPVTRETRELFAPLHSPIAPQHNPSY